LKKNKPQAKPRFWWESKGIHARFQPARATQFKLLVRPGKEITKNHWLLLKVKDFDTKANHMRRHYMGMGTYTKAKGALIAVQAVVDCILTAAKCDSPPPMRVTGLANRFGRALTNKETEWIHLLLGPGKKVHA